MFENGVIDKSAFDKYQIPKDCNFDGVAIEKNFTVLQENRQQAKILSSKKQIMERRELIHSKKMTQYKKEEVKYDSEIKDFHLNSVCEKKLCKIFNKAVKSQTSTNPNIETTKNHPVTPGNDVNTTSSYISFQSMKYFITLKMVLWNKKSILSAKTKAFIRIRSKVELIRGRLAYKNVPDQKEDLMHKLVAMVMYPVKEKYYTAEHVAPVMATDALVESDDDKDNAYSTDNEMI